MAIAACAVVTDFGAGSGGREPRILAGVGVEELHLDRARAESFGSLARQYDRYRPTYPAALFDDLAAFEPMHVLDVGCGTGKAAVALARCGLSVLGIALCRNFYVLDEPITDAFDAVYRRYAPEVNQVWRPMGPKEHPFSDSVGSEPSGEWCRIATSMLSVACSVSVLARE